MASYNYRRPVRNFDLPLNLHALGLETIAVSDFSQADNVLSNPTSQSQSDLPTKCESDLPTNRESDQQEGADSQVDFIITQDDSAHDEPQ
ncbi:hypothetical protein BGX21_001158 [Mortierella sp. AD011]|nr:hypothetical protein BGX20_005385 [Mortierella sp. AD010]KAF9385073.1 hypothetical protein BGX21_001158 [Mortierella sp. AD011]